MKNSFRFILVLLSSFVAACGFYPYGEDVRMSLFSPAHFHYHQFSEFDYSSLSFGPNSVYKESETPLNDKLWADYCKNKVSGNSISEVMNDFKLQDVRKDSKNEFIIYLFKNQKTEALDYLKFAKACEQFNTWMQDPWERNQSFILPQRKILVEKALQKAESAQEKIIKKRYAFLAMRMAFYNEQKTEIGEIYSKYFASNPENVIDYFAMYFKAVSEKNEAKSNYYLAQVFKNIPEKRFVSYQNFYNSQPIETVLKFAKTNDEKASVYLLYGMRSDKNLDYLQAFYQLKPKDEALSFMLLREINKIEDWILTPYYTVFSPSMTGWGESQQNISTKTVFDRVEADRIYAKKVLGFVKNVQLSKVENPDFWKLSKAYLEFLIKDYNSSFVTLNSLKSNDPEFNHQKEIVRTLVIFADQKSGNAIILGETKSVIFKNKNNKRFVFALARELEYRGNSTDAALLMSNADDSMNGDSYDYQNVFWKTMNNRPDIFSAYYTTTFTYLDAVYTPFQMEELQIDLNENQNVKDEFSVWLYSKFHDKNESLNEMIGTKYLRENKLKEAVLAFKKNENAYWDTQNSLWERDGNSSYLVMRSNPFFTLEYTPDFIKQSELIRLNKLSVTQKLIEYIKKAENKNEKSRAYYYFLVANCYYNMTENGNAWMMKRTYLSSYNQSIMVDNEEFNCGNLAKKYYLLARKYAPSKKMEALCLRMAGRCENFKIYNEIEVGKGYLPYYEDGFTESVLAKNKYYQQLRSQYSSDYETLMSNCEAFTRYFAEK